MKEIDNLLRIMGEIEKDSNFDTEIRAASVNLQVALMKFKVLILHKELKNKKSDELEYIEYLQDSKNECEKVMNELSIDREKRKRDKKIN